VTGRGRGVFGLGMLGCMSKFHSLRKMVKETRTSTCTRVIVVENGLDRITVKVNEHLTDWARPFPQHVAESFIETGSQP
jgi:hypothetical protein